MPSPTAQSLRAAFDAPSPLTVGLEEEVMLLDAGTLDLAPRAPAVLAALGGDARFKPELPAAQLEILTPPAATVAGAVSVLRDGRRRLAEAAAAAGLLPAAAGTHPFAAAEGALSSGPRYDAIRAEYGSVARRQLVASLQVHVAVRGADRALAVYNALRSHLPEIAALAANAPFHEGRDTGLASVRPLIAGALPRQGVPPAIPSWEAYAADLRWAADAGAMSDPRQWWWELRPHPVFGTLEVRVPDAQTTLAEAAAVAAFVHALAGRLAAAHDAGERPPPAPSWRIAENRWSACRHGLEGRLCDLASGRSLPARERVLGLIGELEPVAAELGCAAELASARTLAERGGAARQRADAAAGGVGEVARGLADRFTADGPSPPPGRRPARPLPGSP